MDNILDEFEPSGPVGCADVVFSSIVEEEFNNTNSPPGDSQTDNTLYLRKIPISALPNNSGIQNGRGKRVNDSNGELIHWRWFNATISIRQDINMGTASAAEVYKVVFRHEVGHSFWLFHHYDSPCSVTMMCGGTQGFGITPCDRNVVRGIYCPSLLPTPTPPPPPPDVACNAEGGVYNYSNNSCCHYSEPENPYIAGGGYLCEICNDGIDNDCDGATDQEAGPCYNCLYSPVIIDVLGDGFNLTNAADGVMFDIAGNGKPKRLAWTQGDDAWLALDRDGNGKIDNGKELFGVNTWQSRTDSPPNGFTALAEYDKPQNGGNDDGVIDGGDSIFTSLRLWQDSNHNGLSEAGELHMLPSLDVTRLYLDYKTSKKTDRHGNEFRFRAKVDDAKGAKVNRWVWDVFLVAGQ